MTISSSKLRKIRKSKTNAHYLAQAGARVIPDNLCVQSTNAQIEKPQSKKNVPKRRKGPRLTPPPRRRKEVSAPIFLTKPLTPERRWFPLLETPKGQPDLILPPMRNKKLECMRHGLNNCFGHEVASYADFQLAGERVAYQWRHHNAALVAQREHPELHACPTGLYTIHTVQAFLDASSYWILRRYPFTKKRPLNTCNLQNALHPHPI